MNFSCVLIARNEAKTLPRMLDSLKEFRDRGGEIIIVDTGSSDNTAEVARSYGCKVEEVGDRFRKKIDAKLAQKINERFVAMDEAPVVNDGDSLFDFSSARNYAASLAKNDWIWMPDCDEIFTKFDLDEIEKAMNEPNVDTLVYDFVFSHDVYGNAVIQFAHAKCYKRSKKTWKHIVHEVLANLHE